LDMKMRVWILSSDTKLLYRRLVRATTQKQALDQAGDPSLWN